MARIRSIKPEFFTSEVIASLPLSARLTFVGLWTYVDDNGVGLDNARLIVASVWPLEPDPREILQRTLEDLRSLVRAGSDDPIMVRYTLAGRRYLYISHWEEHQKVSHPRKPRYPLPPAPGVTCDDIDQGRHSGASREDYQSPPEILRPEQGIEQGAGSREQGDQRAARAAADEPRLPAMPPDAPPTPGQRAKAITDTYYEAEPLSKWPAVNAIVIRAITDGRWPDEQIQAALLRMAAENRSVTIDALRTELNGFPPPRDRRQDQKTAQFDRALQRAQAREEHDDANRHGRPDPVHQRALPAAGDG